MSSISKFDDEDRAVGDLRAALEATPLIEVACIGVGGTSESPMLYAYMKTPVSRGYKLPKTMGRYRVEYINGAPRPAEAKREAPEAEKIGSAK